MSQSIDFRIHDFINEYLDYKGFRQTVDTFSKERELRQEPIQAAKNGHSLQDAERTKSLATRVSPARSLRW